MASGSPDPDNVSSHELERQDRFRCPKSTLYPPERMTPEQRRREVAALLAAGLVRLRVSAQSSRVAPESGFALGFSGHQRVHTDPAHRTTESR